MRVALVAHVPDDPVVGRVVEPVQDGGQFNHAQPGAEVAAGFSNRFDQVGTQFVGDLRELGFVEAAQVGRRIDPRQARIAFGIDHAGIFAPRVAGGKATRRVAAWGGFRICRAGA